MIGLATRSARAVSEYQTELRDASRVILAAILRDMKTRFGGSYLSFIVAIGWPLTHLIILFGIYVFAHTIAPIGDDPGVFVTTGIAPYILCLYPARIVTITIQQSLPLLQFPIVKPLHLILGRVALEFLSALTTLSIFICIIGIMGYNIYPQDIYQAVTAILLTIYFGVSYGTFGIALYSLLKSAANVILFGIILILYFSAGTVVPSIFMNDHVKSIVWYNPLYHTVGLLRGAYYDTYAFGDYTASYVMLFSSVLLLVGLAAERALRGKFLEG